MQEHLTKNGEIFASHLAKNFGREVVVSIGTPTGIVDLKGVCESIDFNQKKVIIKNKEGTFLVNYYLWVKRLPPKKQEAAKGE